VTIELLEDPDGAPYPEAVQEYVRRHLPPVVVISAKADEEVRIALVAALESVAGVAAERAVSDVANAWQFKGWADVLIPMPTEGIPALAVGQLVTEWLRARADHIRPSERTEP
jgi:hypothetical protein